MAGYNYPEETLTSNGTEGATTPMAKFVEQNGIALRKLRCRAVPRTSLTFYNSGGAHRLQYHYTVTD